MYQKVSIATCCRPLDWLPPLMAQMLNQPAFLIVPSGFSRIKVSLRGRSENAVCACAGAASASHAAVMAVQAAATERCKVMRCLQCVGLWGESSRIHGPNGVAGNPGAATWLTARTALAYTSRNDLEGAGVGTACRL